MSYDYGKNKKKPAAKKNHKTSSRQPLSGWVLFFSGVAFTLFGQFLFHLTQVDTPAQTSHPENTATGQEPAHKKPTINFYNQLKTMEVKVPANDAKKPDITNQPAVESTTQAISETTTSPGNSKIEKAVAVPQQFLQAGSFKSREDADQHRAELLLLGVTASIETKNNADGTSLYRVIIGPFTSATELSKARSTLLSNNIPTLTIKR